MTLGLNYQDNGAATVTLLDNQTLTESYEDTESEMWPLSPFSQLELMADYTEDEGEEGNYADIKLLLSADGVNFHPYSIAADGAPATGLDGNSAVISTLYPRIFRILGNPGVVESRWYAIPSQARFFKIQAGEFLGGSTHGVITVKARISNDKSK